MPFGTFGSNRLSSGGTETISRTRKTFLAWVNSVKGTLLMNQFQWATCWLLLAMASVALASDPPDEWQWRNPVPGGSAHAAITYANGAFVAVGGGDVAASEDGTNWTSKSLGRIYGAGTNYGLEAIAGGDGTWVAVGSGQPVGKGGAFGIMMASADLTNWTTQIAPRAVPVLYGVAYGAGIFVAVGIGSDPESHQDFGAVLTSPDGIHWTLQDSNTSDPDLIDVIYGNGEFVVVSRTGTILTSPDGVNWTPRDSGAQPLSSLTFGNGLYLLAGAQSLWLSPDARSWTYEPLFWGTRSVTYGGGLFVAAGFDGLIKTSPDGLSWTKRNSGTVNAIADICYGNGRFVGIGDSTLIVSSTGSNWLNLASSVTTQSLNDLAYGNGAFVAVGSQGTILHSPDGAQWSLKSPSLTKAELHGVAYGSGAFVAVGWQGVILASTNAIDWVIASNADDVYFSDVTYGVGQFVTVGSNGSVLTSTNGRAWVARDSGFMGDLYSAVYGNGIFIASAWNAVLTSPDGVDWTEHDLTSVTGDDSALLLGLAYGGGAFVAVGSRGLILSSTNGTSWAAESSGTLASLYSVAYGNRTFLVVGGSGTVFSSTNATDWVSRDPGTMELLSGAAYGANTFVVVGGGGAILQSGAMPSVGAMLTANPGWTNGAFAITVSAALGGQLEIQGSEDLLNWLPLGSVTLSNTPAQFIDNGASGLSRRFYRALSR